ncbi:MAG TPA: hypothetical protein VGM84_08110 [Steroidobacteraceae bacterium]|jgi:hypothetical protein
MRSHLIALAVTLGLAGSIAVAGPAAVGSSGGGSSSGGSVSSGGGGGGGHSGGGGGGGGWHGSANGANGGGWHGGARGGVNGSATNGHTSGVAPGRTPGSYRGDAGGSYVAGNAYPGHGIYNYHGSRGSYGIVGTGSTGVGHGSAETISDHSARSTLAVGPRTGSAAKAALVTNQHSPHHPGTPGRPGKPHHPKHSNPAVEYRRQGLYASQQPYIHPQFCPYMDTEIYAATVGPAFGCPPPVKLRTKGLPGN